MAKPNSISKEKLLESALKVIGEQGIEKLTLKAVADGAEVTQGTVYYHFKTKDQLLLEVVEEICRKSWSEMEKSKELNISEALESARIRATTDVYYHKIFFSLLVKSFQNEEMQNRLGRLLDEENVHMANQLNDLHQNPVIKNISNDTMGVLINALIDGLAIQSLLNKQLDMRKIYQELEAIFHYLIKKEDS